MILCRRCVAVGTPGGYSLYTLNSTDALEPVYQSGEILLLVIIEILLLASEILARACGVPAVVVRA